jgi:hypothetical protein
VLFDCHLAAGKLRRQRRVEQRESIPASTLAYQDLALEQPEPPGPFFIAASEKQVRRVRAASGRRKIAMDENLPITVERFLWIR